MTRDEFALWLSDYCESFPETAAWLNVFGTAKSATIKRWHDVFVHKSVRLDDAKSVTQNMLRGDMDCVPAFSREQTPAIVAKLAREISFTRRCIAGPESDPNDATHDQSGPVNLGGLFRKLVKMQESGQSVEDREKWLASEFGESDDRRDMKSCTLCGDTGMVRCVSAGSTIELLRLSEGKGVIKVAVAACTCAAGDRVRDKKTLPLPRFAPFEHVRIRKTDDLTRAACAELLEDRAAVRGPSQTTMEFV